MAIQKKVVWGLALLAAVLPGKAVWAQQPHARLAASLQNAIAAQSKTPIDVIVRCNANDVDAIAARRHLTIKKRLDDGAVFRASAAEVGALASELEQIGRRKAAVPRASGRTATARRVVAAARSGEGVAKIARTEALSESEIRLHLALADSQRKDTTHGALRS